MNGNDYKKDNNTPPGQGIAIIFGCFGIYFVIDRVIEGIDLLISLFLR